jgi:hypothetical protein
MKSLIYSCLAIIGLVQPPVGAFHIVSRKPRLRYQGEACVCFSSDPKEATGLVVSLDKPLGMILEEFEEGEAKGATVTGLQEDGSAFSSEFKDQLVGLRLVSVMGESVSDLMFDDVMKNLVEAPTPVTLELKAADFVEEISPAVEQFSVGSLVSIKVLDGDEETVVEAKVGDNLRKVLLENNFEVYKGLKQKLGNW